MRGFWGEDSSFEHPTIRGSIAELRDWLDTNAAAMSTDRDPEQTGMRDVPDAAKKPNITTHHRNLVLLNQLLERARYFSFIEMKPPTRKSVGKPRIDLRAIGRRIRELRGFEMTQAEFAKRIGVAQSYLSALERGEKEPGAGVLLAISQEFTRSVDWLLTGEPPK